MAANSSIVYRDLQAKKAELEKTATEITEKNKLDVFEKMALASAVEIIGNVFSETTPKSPSNTFKVSLTYLLGYARSTAAGKRSGRTHVVYKGLEAHAADAMFYAFTAGDEKARKTAFEALETLGGKKVQSFLSGLIKQPNLSKDVKNSAIELLVRVTSQLEQVQVLDAKRDIIELKRRLGDRPTVRRDPVRAARRAGAA